MKAIIAVLFALVLTGNAVADNLYEDFKYKPEIRVYLKDVTSEVEDPAVNIKLFREIFNEVLLKRLNMRFVPVNSMENADVIITALIKGYVFNEKVLPSFFSTASIVADTAAPKAAAKLVVDYKVISPVDGGVILKAKNFTTDERRPQKDMNSDNAFAFAANKNVNRFIFRSFYKERN